MQRHGSSKSGRYARYALVAAISLLLLCIVWQKKSSRHSQSERSRGIGYQFTYGDNCVEMLNSGGWVGEPLLSCDDTAQLVATCGKGADNSWQWSSDAVRCGARRLNVEGFQELLAGKWVSFIGDSITRNTYAAFLRLISPDGDMEVITGHKDFEYTFPGGIRASFFWAPFVRNVTAVLEGWDSGKRPDAVLMSIGLWDMLHIHSAPAFQNDLAKLEVAAQAFSKFSEPKMTICSVTEVHPPKLKAEDKRARMTPENVDIYNTLLAGSRLLHPLGPAYLVDVHRLTQGCGGQCTNDGVHYSNATYDAALQVWGNQLKLLL